MSVVFVAELEIHLHVGMDLWFVQRLIVQPHLNSRQLLASHLIT